MEYIKPDKAIEAMEQEVIYPNIELFPTLAAIIQKDAPEDDKSFLKAIQAAAKKYQTPLKVYEVANDMEAGDTIIKLRTQISVSGIILLSDFGAAQRGLGNMIPTLLDIDCANSATMGMLIGSDSVVGYRLAPAVAVACYKYLEYNDMDLAGQNVAIIGRSTRVGRPLAEILLQEDASTTIFHSKSDNIDLSPFDVVISTIGKANKIKRSWWKNGFKTKYIIDAGFNVSPRGKVYGDIDIATMDEENFKINPIVGGLGKLTTVTLFAKLYSNALGRIPEAMVKRGVK